MKDKKKIMVKMVFDSREKDTSYLNDFRIDTGYKSDGVWIATFQVKTPFKCADNKGKEIEMSTGDVGYEYSLDGGVTWNKTNLSIELKKESDFITTLTGADSFKRFKNELKRAKDNKLDFYIVYNTSDKLIMETERMLEKTKRAFNISKTLMDKHLTLLDEGVKIIHTENVARTIRYIIKYHIKKVLRKSIDR